MEKPNSLRAALTQAAPGFATNPEWLIIRVEKGRIRSPLTGNRGFALEYQLILTVIECTLHPSVLFLAINDWLARNQPDLLRPDAHAGFTFEAEYNDFSSVDIEVALDLTEQVALVDDGAGGLALQHQPEPDLSWLVGGDPFAPALIDLTAHPVVP